MKKFFILASASLSSFFMFVSFSSAQTTAGMNAAAGIGTVAGLIESVTATIVNALGSLAMAAAVVAFFYGLVHFIWGLREGKPDVITNGKKFMGWSLVALFVMFSVYGIISFVQQTVMPGTNFRTIIIPEINFGRGGTSAAPAPTANPLAPASGGVTLIQETNGWKYYTDGTAIGPDGTYYYQGQAVTGANGQGNPVANQSCDGLGMNDCNAMGCTWDFSSDSCRQ